MDTEYLKDKFAGCLQASVIGDALGAPAEDMTPLEVMSKLHTPIDGYYGSKAKNIKPGQYTSESAAATIVARILLKTAGQIEPESFKIALKEEHFDERTLPAKFAASTAFSRIIPIALLAAAKSMEPAEVIKNIKIVTKESTSKIDLIAIFVFACAIQELIRHPEMFKSPAELYDSDKSLLARMVEMARKSEDRISDIDIADRLSERLDFVRRKLMGRGCNLITMAGYTGNDGGVSGSLSLILFAYMNAPDDFATVYKVVSLGGSSSLNGSMIGALIGATIGSGFMPSEMKDNVQNGLKIETLAFKLAEICQPPKPEEILEEIEE